LFFLPPPLAVLFWRLRFRPACLFALEFLLFLLVCLSFSLWRLFFLSPPLAVLLWRLRFRPPCYPLARLCGWRLLLGGRLFGTLTSFG
jgi:hypothetical protein